MSARAGERGALAAMVAATLLWGGTFVAIRDAVAGIAPATLVFMRFTASALAFAVMLAVRRRAIRGRDLAAGAITGTLMLGGFFFQAEGLRWTSAGSSAFLTCAGTLLAAFFAWPLLGQRPTRLLVAGIALAMAGSAVLSLRAGFHLGRGEALTLLGAGVFALQVVSLGRFAPNAELLPLALAQSLAVALATSFAAPDALHVLRTLTAANAARLGYLAVAGSTIAPLLQIHAQRRLSAGRIGLLFALEPLFALACALTLGAEHFAPRWWLGAALILSAVVMAEWRAAFSTPRPATS